MKFIFILLVGLVAMAGISQAQTSPIAPNGVTFVGNDTTLSAGVPQNISVQIQYSGGPLKSEGVRVYILANDTSKVPAGQGTYVLTDSNGIAVYTVTANGTGSVTLTATAMSVSSKISADRVFQITTGPVATPTQAATATPSPSATGQPSSTATIAPTTTIVPTSGPTIEPTAQPTAAPETGDQGAQARGIIAVGIALAIIILVVIAASQLMKKK